MQNLKIFFAGLIWFFVSLAVAKDLKVANVQFNPTVGDFEGNLAKTIEMAERAIKNGADIIVFPEMSVAGYPPMDLVNRPEMIERTNKALERIKEYSRGKDALIMVGHVQKTPGERGKPFQNAMTAFHDGRPVHNQAKMLLPTYNIFDEARIFEPATQNKVFEWKGVKIGVGICEDLWFHDTHSGRELYKTSPIAQMKKQKPQLVVSMSASPWNVGKSELRESIHGDVARQLQAPLVYSNQTGGTDDIIFDGQGFVTDREGKVRGRMGFLKDGVAYSQFDVPENGGPARLKATSKSYRNKSPSDIEAVRRTIVQGIKDYASKTGQGRVVLGLSGGIDSALVAELAVEALGPENVEGVLMPSRNSSSHSIEDAEKLAKNLGIKTKTIHLEEAHKAFGAMLGEELLASNGGLVDQNIQARTRGTIVMSYANSRPGTMALVTTNKVEAAVGYGTLGGDLMGGYSPIIDLYKGEVFALSEHINQTAGRDIIPRRSITKPPSAELAPGQIDSNDLPDYDVLDRLIYDYFEKNMPLDELVEKYTGTQPQRPKDWVEKIVNKFNHNDWKRALVAPGPRVSQVAFGPGRQVPRAKKWYDVFSGDDNPPRPQPSEVERMVKVQTEGSLSERRSSQADNLIKKIDRAFRSSDRYIAADVLWNEAVKSVPSKDLRQLARTTQSDLVAALKRAREINPEMKINKGVAENLIKLQKMAKHHRNLRQSSEHFGDRVFGLRQDRLDRLVAGLPEPSDELRRAGEFDYRKHELAEAVKRSILDNDHYNIKVAGNYFMNGLNDKYEATFSMFSRGHGNRGYMIASGVDQVVDMLENLHFTEAEIQELRRRPDLQELPDEFFEYLRNFKFKGKIRAVKPGTAVFANVPIMEFIGNPIEVQIIETLVTPIVNLMSNSATKAARIVREADGRKTLEGGTRRGANGYLTAIAANEGGMDATSNMKAGRLGQIPYGGTTNHAQVGHYVDELQAYITQRKLFKPGQHLIDTYDIMEGLRKAIQASNLELSSIRLDSTLPGMDKAETTKVVRELLDDLDYKDVGIVYSDGIDEFELRRMKKAPFNVILAGTEVVVPSDTNTLKMVYKATSLVDRKTGEKLDPVKIANGKTGLTGAKQVYRVEGPDGKFSHDVLSSWEEKPLKKATPLIEDVWNDGKRLRERAIPQETAKYVHGQLDRFDEKVTNIDAGKGAYTVEVSDTLQKRQKETIAKRAPSSKTRVGVYLGSFDPPHEGHKELIRRMKLTYGLDEVVVVPTGDDPVHGKKYTFDAKKRVKMLKEKLKGLEGVRIDEREVRGESRFSRDTLRGIEKDLPNLRNTDLYVMGGEDLLKTLPKWKDGRRLFNRYNWIMAAREGGSGKIDLPEEWTRDHAKYDDQHFRSKSGKITHVIPIRGLPDESSTKVRRRIGNVDTVFHNVDTQKTFWQAMHGSPDGPLALAGTPEIAQNLNDLSHLGLESERVKVISTIDYHYPIEVDQAEKFNLEFAPPEKGGPGFPAHGMADVDGPVGAERIPEVRVFDREKQLVVPHREPSADGKSFPTKRFALDPHLSDVLDPNVEIVMKKNGALSYDVFQNPRAQKVYDYVNPERVIVYGVATDFCVKAAVEHMVKKFAGKQILVVKDAVRGVDCLGSKEVLKDLEKKGVKIVTTDEVFKMHPEAKTAHQRRKQGKTNLKARKCIGRSFELANKGL